MRRHSKTTVPPGVADLLERLAEALDVQLTLTDDLGGVLVSTDGQPRGRVDVLAAATLAAGPGGDSAGASNGAGDGGDDGIPDEHGPTVHRGMFEPEPRVCYRLEADGRTRGALIAHGAPEGARAAARAAAIGLGFALEVAQRAHRSALDGLGPDLMLHQLLRGPKRETRRTAAIAKVVGWDLDVPRVGLIVTAARGAGGSGLHQDHYAMIAEFVDRVVPDTPMGRMKSGEWVLLPELPSRARVPAPRQLAQDILTGLTENGASVTVGLGEAHAQSSVGALRRSYREARHAARWGERLRGAGRVYQLADLGAAAFVSLDHPTRWQLADRILHPLRRQADVLASLSAFLDSDGSIAAAAARTGAHRHTIRHHLDRVQELTRMDPRSLEGAFHLRLALLVSSSRPRPPRGGSPA